MEIAGLAIGVAPLVSLCLEFLDRRRDFKGYKSSSLQLNARFELAKSRLKQWARAVGIVDGDLTDPHHPLLDQFEVRRVVSLVLNCLLNNFGGSVEAAEVATAQRHRHTESVPLGWKRIQRSNTDDKKVKSGTTSKNALLWATGQKAAFTEQVEIFEVLVEKLHDVVPLDNTESALQSATEALEQVKLTQEEMLALVRSVHRDRVLQKMKSTDEWLDAPSVDQDLEKYSTMRLQGTCDWLFKNDTYLAWESEEYVQGSAKLFRLCAPPGHGKTVLAAMVTQRMIDTKASPVAYFFSSLHVQFGNPPHAVIRSWISQLMRTEDRIFELVYGQVATSKTLKATEAEIWKLFRECILAVSGCTLVLDGYDEFARSGDMRKDFLRRLKEQVANTKTRVFVSSRPEDDIEAELPLSSTVSGLSLAGHRITAEDLQADIALYSRSAVTEQLPGKTEAFQQELADQIVSKCDGMFLWIKLQKSELRDGKSKKQLRETIDKMPDGLTQSYSRTWDDIMAKSDYDRQRAIEILRWACFATSPLTVEELTEALVHEFDAGDPCEDDMPDEINEKYIDGEIKGLCGSMIEIQRDTSNKDEDKPAARIVRLVHTSAKEFLVTKLPTPLPISIRTPEASEHALHHMHLAEVCLRYLDCDISWKPSISDPGDSQSRFTKRFMKYAATKWWKHWKEANMMSEEYKRLTSQLFAIDNPHFGEWTENDLFYDTAWTERKNEAGLNARLYLAVFYELPHIVDYLHTHGKLDFSPTTFSNGTPLMAAAWEAPPFFENLLSWGADINVECGRDGSALGAAVLAGKLERARVLLDRGADLKIRDWEGEPILTLACWKDNLDLMKLLLDHGVDPSDYDKVSKSPLIRCIKSQNIAGVKLLLDHGVDYTLPDDDGVPPLHYACAFGNIEIVNLMLDKGADVLQRGRWKRTALHEAAFAAQEGVVRALMKRESNLLTLAGVSETTMHPIHHAALSGSIETMKALMEYGADIQQLTNETESTLHFACKAHDSAELVSFLLDNGVDIAGQDRTLETPLHVAALAGFPTVVKTLLERGANIHAMLDRDNDCRQPIHCAAKSGNVKTLQVLVDYGADIHIPTTDFRLTPLHYACIHKDLEMVNFLIENGADLMIRAYDGHTPCHVASRNGNLEVLRLLVEKGADLFRTTDDGWSPLHWACAQGSKDVVMFLIEKGADVLQPEHKSGRTPLHLACLNDINDPSEIVKLLLEKGSDITQVSHDEATALHFACSNKCEAAIQAVNFLLDRGMDPMQLSKKGIAPLHRAAQSGNIKTIRVLLDRSGQIPEPAKPTANSFSLMHFAVESGDRHIVRYLIEENVPIEHMGRLKTTPLWSAIRRRCDDIVEELVDAGADVLVPLWHGDTAIEWIEWVLPGHEKLQQWQSKIKFQVPPEDRKIWLKQEICDIACDALLVDQYGESEYWSSFLLISLCLWRLGAKLDFLFASSQMLLPKNENGRPIHDRHCDGCGAEPIIGERWVCFTCPLTHSWTGVDLCGSCKSQLPNIENVNLRKCFEHDLVSVPCFEGEGIKHEMWRAKDPEVRKWLETVVEQYKVDGPMPSPVPITQET